MGKTPAMVEKVPITKELVEILREAEKTDYRPTEWKRLALRHKFVAACCIFQACFGVLVSLFCSETVLALILTAALQETWGLFAKWVPDDWVLYIGMLACTSFAPTYGCYMVSVMCGYFNGDTTSRLVVSIVLVSLGTIVAEVASWYHGRLHREKVASLEKTNLNVAALGRMAREPKGSMRWLPISVYMRLPWLVRTTMNAACDMPFSRLCPTILCSVVVQALNVCIAALVRFQVDRQQTEAGYRPFVLESFPSFEGVDRVDGIIMAFSVLNFIGVGLLMFGAFTEFFIAKQVLAKDEEVRKKRRVDALEAAGLPVDFDIDWDEEFEPPKREE
ncbi:hypothetical protein QBC39DRAFT_432808 [Podospora conica]|nr:hypothetical protein QBC39DRAFT_432808 [Schizothecium conicum]